MSFQLPPSARPVRLGDLAAVEALPVRQTRATVVLVPGYTGSKEDFLAILEALTEAGHRVIAYDQRGQFESTGGDDPAAYEIPALAGDLLDLIGDEPAHVVGHSFGGLVSRAAAIRDPSRFRSLTLLDSGPSAIPGLRAMTLEVMRPVLVEGGHPAVWQYMENTELPAEVAEFTHRRFHSSSQAGLLVMGDALLAEPDRTHELRGTGLPMLVAHGERDDAWPPEVQAAMALQLGARHEVIAGAAHSPAVEQPEATARVLVEFWALVEDAPAQEAQGGTP
jgi:pimeloyl-ACP methyl ester carboxylesterase